MRFLLETVQLLLVTGGVAALYRYVPNTHVRWSHAVIGAVFATLSLELAKNVLGWYLGLMPTYSLVYGTFATVPILLVWIFVAWVIILLGAVVAAYLPSLLLGVARRGDTPGWDFQLALELLGHLGRLRTDPQKGMGLEVLAQVMRVDVLQLEEPVAALVALDWLGRLDEEVERYVLLIDPERTSMAPLLDRLLLVREPQTARFWSESGWNRLTVAQALAAVEAQAPGTQGPQVVGPSVASG